MPIPELNWIPKEKLIDEEEEEEKTDEGQHPGPQGARQDVNIQDHTQEEDVFFVYVPSSAPSLLFFSRITTT